ncbi:DUF3892 domain-containing protein [Brevundimonas sp. M20]|uniref:DUF3892 domain-containing protein n=1 Tax=Brevundimonas sp. M20 TaxID=2591463 RepID=UPI001146C5D4|nr:DUF3892 domain-containing protein [Brevundimonas sp. M20]QDH74256.1 DUF3892 domain-containing protein [Brevundimonas sp. M20]
MATRYVTKSGKDKDGDITKLCNNGEIWSPRLKADAIRDIENRDHEYWVNWTDGQKTQVKVVNGSTGKYLRTQRDGSTKNNLDDLPDC